VEITARITADLVEQAETEREMKQHVFAAEKIEKAKQIAAEKYQKELIEQVKAREEQKEFAYQQAGRKLRIMVNFLMFQIL